jgi:putative transposase
MMREHDLQPRRRRRHVATTDSDHDQPIYPNRTRELTVDGPNRLGASDITYVAVAAGFAYVAAILDAWSLRVVGHAISRSIDVRLTLAAPNAPNRKEETATRLHPPLRPRLAIRRLSLSPSAASARLRRLDGATRHSVRQRQGGELHDPKGREANTLKVEAVYPMADETFADVAEDLPVSLMRSTTNAPKSPL